MNEEKKAEMDSGKAPSVDMTDGYWNEHELVSISDFRDIDGEIRTHYFERCELENDEARYFCAVNGECFGLICRNSDSSCLAEIETALSYASKGYRYTTFALKSRTTATLNGDIKLGDERRFPLPDSDIRYPTWQQVLPEAGAKIAFSVALNAQLLLDLAKALGSDGSVTLRFIDEMSPIAVTLNNGNGNGEYGVLMPMRVS